MFDVVSAGLSSSNYPGSQEVTPEFVRFLDFSTCLNTLIFWLKNHEQSSPLSIDARFDFVVKSLNKNAESIRSELWNQVISSLFEDGCIHVQGKTLRGLIIKTVA